jgi:hypothetical protein
MMNPAAPEMRNLARWLIDREVKAGNPSEVKVQAAFRTCEKLRLRLSKLMGVAGFQSLLCRAMTLAKAEAPWLGAVEVNSDGSLEGVGRIETQQDIDAAEKGGLILLTQLLGLLVTFIGEPLTLRLVRDLWPDTPSTL